MVPSRAALEAPVHLALKMNGQGPALGGSGVVNWTGATQPVVRYLMRRKANQSQHFAHADLIFHRPNINPWHCKLPSSKRNREGEPVGEQWTPVGAVPGPEASALRVARGQLGNLPSRELPAGNSRGIAQIMGRNVPPLIPADANDEFDIQDKIKEMKPGEIATIPARTGRVRPMLAWSTSGRQSGKAPGRH